MNRNLVSIAAFGVALFGLSAAHAAPTCYGFSGLQDERKFAIGETFEAEHLTVYVRPYLLNATALTPVGHYVQVMSKAIAESKAAEKSEIYIYGATMQIVPRTPVSQVEFRLAENRGTPSGGRHANLQINGKVHEVSGSLRDLEGKVFDGDAGTRVRVSVKLRPHAPPDGDWFSGTMQLRAVAGQIASFGIGGTPLVVDDVCFTPNAP